MAVTYATTITGSLYDARTGAKITSGRLYLKLKDWASNGPDIVAPKTVSYNIPGSGNISLTVCPSFGVDYFVEFDPNPSDTDTPLRLKDGYFSNVWTVPYTLLVPGTDTVSISAL